MVKPEWGAKRSCPKCGTRFYDLGKSSPATCIDCGEEWEPEPILKPKQPIPFDDESKCKGIEADSDLADDDLDDLDDVDEDENRPDSDVDLGDDDDLGVAHGSDDKEDDDN